MRIRSTTAALVLSAQALPSFSGFKIQTAPSDEVALEPQTSESLWLSQQIQTVVEKPAPRSGISPASKGLSQQATRPPSGRSLASDPKPVSDCRYDQMDDFRLYFNVPPTPYGRKRKPKDLLVVSVATGWHAKYHKTLRKKIEKDTGLLSIRDPRWYCGWNRALDIETAGVHRGTVDIALGKLGDGGDATTTMDGELKNKLEQILRTTYPVAEIILILLFTLFPLWLVAGMLAFLLVGFAVTAIHSMITSTFECVTRCCGNERAGTDDTGSVELQATYTQPATKGGTHQLTVFQVIPPAYKP